jgi:hypothetical protein
MDYYEECDNPYRTENGTDRFRSFLIPPKIGGQFFFSFDVFTDM